MEGEAPLGGGGLVEFPRSLEELSKAQFGPQGPSPWVVSGTEASGAEDLLRGLPCALRDHGCRPIGT